MTHNFAKDEARRRTGALETNHYVYEVDGGFIVTDRKISGREEKDVFTPYLVNGKVEGVIWL
jgi:hypothetical protein